jgi:biotin carboxyl carrier protein
MKVVVKNGGNEKVVKVLKKEGSVFHVSIGDREYKLDIEKVEDGVYSIINEGRSINMEMIETDSPGQYKVNTLHNFFNIEVVPVSSGIGIEKNKQDALQKLTSPMSGKIVKINAIKGEIVAEGASLIILSAMKMENEFNSTVSGTVTRIEVKEGDLVREGQLLLEIKATIN